MDQVMVSKIVEKISLVGTGLLDIIHFIELYTEDGKQLDINAIHKEATEALTNMEELHRLFSELTRDEN
jgi:hypothetical protein